MVLSSCHVARSRMSDGDASKERYFCPLTRCQGDKRPHFIIDRARAHDQYGYEIDFSHHVNKDVCVLHRWYCEHTHTEGYGALSLLSAVMGFGSTVSSLSRQQMVELIQRASSLCGIPCTEVADDARNGWLYTNPPADEWRMALSDTFSPEALSCLSLRTLTGVSIQQITDILHREFGLWQVEKYITAGCYPSGDHAEGTFRSYERRAHALFPIFAFCYDVSDGLPIAENPEKRQEPWVARIVMPAFIRRSGDDFDWKSDFWTAFATTDHRRVVSDFRFHYPVYGDVVAMACANTNDDAPDVVGAYQTGEILVTQKETEVEKEVLNKNGEPTGKTKTVIENVDLDPEDVRLGRCVLCKSPLDAVASFVWLNYPRLRFPDSQYAQSFWHVSWLAHDAQLLNTFESRQLSRVATDTFQLLGNDRSEIAIANTNALRNNDLRLCMLPTSMSEMAPVDGGIGVVHIPHSPIDFFNYYEPTDDELSRNVLVAGSTEGVKSLLLQKELKGSSALRPFVKTPKKKRAPGEKSYTYEIDMNAAWQMMINKGYCRSLIPTKKRDTIGQCYRIDGHFVYELDPDSVMADMRKSLEDYAKDNAFDTKDTEMMMNAMLRCKDLQYAKNITKLPLMAMPRSESFSAELDYFFFRNGALEITPSHITFRSYSELDFLVYRSQVLPFDYHTPFYGSRAPISIRQSEEYERMQREYDEARRVGEKTPDELFDMRQRLHDFSMVGRWQISIRPTEDFDERIVVPKKIREDEQHNEWLRWWPFLRLLRCFANENFADEEAGRFTDADRQALMARMANLMFTIGRCIFRFRGVQYMPFFLENTVDREGMAQGGSGKSVLIEHFMRFARYVLNVDGKNLKNNDFANNFANYIRHKHDVVHVEDFPKMPIDPLYNYASGVFRARTLFESVQEVSHAESPNVVISSNFMVQSTAESTLGRVQFGGMSHYFSREVPVMNKPGRTLDTIMPDIRIAAEQENYGVEYSDAERGQIIYTLAKCVQFNMLCIRENVQVAVPGTDLLERLSRTELGDSFYDWFTNFLLKPHIYNVPISINEIFNSYRSYLDPSKARIEMVSRTRFYENLQKFCAKPAHGVLFMPIKPFLSTSDVNRSRKRVEDGTEKSYLRKGACWLTRSFVDDKGHVHHARVLSKNAGEGSVTGGAVWFSQRGKEPKSQEEFQQMLDVFMQSPDPEPILDENEQPVTEAQYSQWTMLNTEEEAEIIRKAGGARRVAPSVNTSVQAASVSDSSLITPNSSFTGEASPQGELPF